MVNAFSNITQHKYIMLHLHLVTCVLVDISANSKILENHYFLQNKRTTLNADTISISPI